MQHMPDKDFDKLFKDRFMDVEVEPSADLWGNIAEQLEPKKKRSLPIMWMAAASVVVVASVMLATQSNEKVQLKGTTTEVAAVKPADEVRSLPKVANDETDMVAPEVLQERKVTTRTLVKKDAVKEVSSPVEDTQKNNFIAVQPSSKVEHLPIKKAGAMPLDVTPVEEVIANNNTATVYANSGNVARTVDYVEDVEDANDNKKGIRNVGDLVNYVVDKVDKRDKKLIKFDTDDDDNSSIIGLNIGFLKFNKKNK